MNATTGLTWAGDPQKWDRNSRCVPPVGWQRMVEQAAQKTTVVAWLNTVVLNWNKEHKEEA